MMITATSSLDTPDVSSNDEDDMSNYSSHSSQNSTTGQPTSSASDDPSAVVDDTGHLRPVTEDDIILDLDSASEDDDDDDDGDSNGADYGESVGRSITRSTAIVSKSKRQDTQKPPAVLAKSARPSRKIQPADIPKITVVDFGEDAVTDREQNEDDATSEVHVEPVVIVENEQPNKRWKRLKKTGPRTPQAPKTNKAKVKTSQRARTNDQSATTVTNDAELLSEQTSGVQTGPGDEAFTYDASGPSRDTNDDAGRSVVNTNQQAQSTQGRKSKTKFSKLLARFQRMDENG